MGRPSTGTSWPCRVKLAISSLQVSSVTCASRRAWNDHMRHRNGLTETIDCILSYSPCRCCPSQTLTNSSVTLPVCEGSSTFRGQRLGPHHQPHIDVRSNRSDGGARQHCRKSRDTSGHD